MKVWKDIFTGDAMVSNDYKHKEVFQTAGLEVKAKILTHFPHDSHGII